MDILKIRKRAKEGGDREAPPPAAAPVVASSPAPPDPEEAPAPPPPTLPASPAFVEQATVRVSGAWATAPAALDQNAPEHPPPAARRAAETGGVTRPASSLPSLRDIDPLGEFLAYYDQQPLAEDELEPLEKEKAQVFRRYLAFSLAQEDYAMSILEVREILKTFAVTKVPGTSAGILGVLSKRGVVMPVVDLAACLGLRDPDATVRGEQRILVIGDGDEVCGLRVDRVHAVVQLNADEIDPVPGGLGARTAGLLSGLGRDGPRKFIVLDARAFLAFLHGFTLDGVPAGAARGVAS